MEKTVNMVLEEMAGQLDGLLGVGVVGMDGVAIATHVPSGSILNVELTTAQLATMMKLAKTTAGKLRAGEVEDDLLTTATNHVLIKPLNDNCYLGLVTDKNASLGMVRLVAKAYVNRLCQLLPDSGK